jgi:hypothetical protein
VIDYSFSGEEGLIEEIHAVDSLQFEFGLDPNLAKVIEIRY